MARLDLLHEGTEIKSFSDVKGIEDSMTHFDGRIASYCDLLTRDDAQSTIDGLPYFQMSSEGAYGLSYFLEDCKTIINKLFDGYFEIERGPKRKQVKKESSLGEKSAEVSEGVAATISAPVAENKLPDDATEEEKENYSKYGYIPAITRVRVDDLCEQALEITKAVSILTMIEDHHFTFSDSPLPGAEDFERIGTLVVEATNKLIGAGKYLEDMAGGSETRQFGLTGKSADKDNPEEKQEQVALPPDFVLFEQMIDTIFSYQSKIKCACSIFYTLNGAADMSNMVKPEKVAEMINLMQVVNSSLQDLDKGFKSFFDDATGIPLRSIKELVPGELT